MASRGHRVIDDRPGARAHRLQKPPLGVVLEVLDRHRGRRIADERVKPAVLLSDGREQAFRVIAAGDIRLDNQRLRCADGGELFLQFVVVGAAPFVGQYQLRAVPRKSECGRQTDALGAAGDEDDPAGIESRHALRHSNLRIVPSGCRSRSA